MEIKLDGEKLQQVDEFTYLGSVMTENGKCKKDIKRRIIGISLTKVKLYETIIADMASALDRCSLSTSKVK